MSAQLRFSSLPDMSSQMGRLQQQMQNLPPESLRMLERQIAARIDSPERFTTRVNLNSPKGKMQMETEARWVAAQCGAR